MGALTATRSVAVVCALVGICSVSAPVSGRGRVFSGSAFVFCAGGWRGWGLRADGARVSMSLAHLWAGAGGGAKGLKSRRWCPVTVVRDQPLQVSSASVSASQMGGLAFLRNAADSSDASCCHSAHFLRRKSNISG